MRDLRDLKADWRRWTPNERIVGLFGLPVVFAIAALPYLMAS